MNKLFFLFLASLIFSSCEKNNDEPEIPVPEDKPLSEVTVWTYFVADTNIKSDIRNNIKTMYVGLSKMEKQATLLVYWDGGRSDTYLKASPCILRYTTDGYGNINGVAARDSIASMDTITNTYTKDIRMMKFVANQGELVKKYSSQLSTDKNVMTSVLKDMSNLTSTDKIALVAGSHGSAWLNSIFTSYNTRSFGQDGSGTDNTITTSDMAKAIASAGIQLELLLFDACYMGTVEVCYDLRKVTNYQIVSVLEIPAAGFPYNDVLPFIYEGTPTSYKQVCQGYIDYYKKLSNTQNVWGTVSLIDALQMDNLAQIIKYEIVSHKESLSDYNPTHLQEYGRKSGKYISFDLEQFIRDLNNGVSSSSLNSVLENTVLYKGCLEEDESYDDGNYNFDIDQANYCGLGMYIPVKEHTQWNTYFKTIDWYTAAGWNQVTFSWE